MDLENKLLSSFILFEERINTHSYAHKTRSEAIKKFEKTGFPNKEEAWKYTPLKKFLKDDFSIFPTTDIALDYKDIKRYLIHDIDSYKIIFVNGVYSSHLSETTHDGMDICVMSAGLTRPKYDSNVQKFFDKTTNQKDQLTTLNTAFTKEGAYIYIPKGKKVNKPIQIINFITETNNKLFLQPRNLIVLEKGVQVQIIERNQNLSKSDAFFNVVTEVFLEKKSKLEYYKIQNDNENASLVDNTYVSQEAESNASFHTFSFGGELTRNNLNFYQKGERCNSSLRGITLTSNTQHIDHYTLVHHENPNCESHQDYKGIYMDSSTGIFNGKIMVEDSAQKINAFQKNNNILVGDKATVNAKPQLEIFADDVRCSHGCTIGQLEKEALFYLNSRGIPEQEAKGLLLYAFANDIINSVEIPEVKHQINKFIKDKLSVDMDFIL